MGLGFFTRAGDEVVAPDVALMLRVCQDDEEAFAGLYNLYHRRVLDFFYALCRNSQTAADLCQETFFRIWKVRHRYAATGAFKAYLFTFARNIWLEHCRERRKIFKLGYRKDLDESTNELLARASDRPDAGAGRSEMRDLIQRALDQLPEEQRMVFVLRNVEGLSLEETATIMQCPVNTVRSRRLLAMKKLRAALQGTYRRSLG